MADTTFRSGDPTMIDYTPSGADVDAGEVVLLGNTTGLTCGIAHIDIEDGRKDALAAGGGIYDCVNLNNAAVGAKVYWDNTNKKVTTVSSSNALFGFVCEAGEGGANTTCRVLHKPYV